jgi:hypothetical protein
MATSTLGKRRVARRLVCMAIGSMIGAAALYVLFLFSDQLDYPLPSPTLAGAIIGAVAGGAFSRGRVGAFGWSLLSGTLIGAVVASQLDRTFAAPYYGAVVGMLIGTTVGMILELKREHFPQNGHC